MSRQRLRSREQYPGIPLRSDQLLREGRGRRDESAKLQQARDTQARSARPVAGFELTSVDGPPISLASLTSKNKVTLFAFFFPT